MSKKNVIYICCIANPWVDVINNLSNYGFSAKYIIHWRDEYRNFYNSFRSECHLQSVEDAWRGKGFPKEIIPTIFDEKELIKMAWFENQAFNMMNRLDPTDSRFSFTNRQYYFRDLVGYWYSIVKKHKINLVVSPSIPHRVFDFALYTVCMLLGTKFISFQMTPFGSNSILIDDIYSMPKVNISNKEKYLFPSILIKKRIETVLEKYDIAEPDYMIKHKKNNSSLLLPYKIILKKILRNLNNKNIYKFISPNTYWVSRYRMPKVKMGWLEYFIINMMHKNKINKLATEYISIINENSDFYSTKYIFVALHYQPEETSCPTGGSYSDQINIIKLLNEVLDPTINIVVKEHKSQFYKDQEGSSGRSDVFYSRISSISERVLFVGLNENPFDLIDKAMATVTISGTIGWESAIRGTPTLCFGRAWYEGMPNVFKIKTKDELIDVIRKLENLKDKNIMKEIYSFHHILEKSFVNAIHYKANQNKDDVSYSKSVNNIVEALKNINI